MKAKTIRYRELLSKCGSATLLNPLGGRTTYVVGPGALTPGVNQLAAGLREQLSAFLQPRS